MNILYSLFLSSVVITLIIMDALGKIRLLHPLFLMPALFIQVNLIFLLRIFHSLLPQIPLLIPAGLLLTYICLRFHILPVPHQRNLSLRLTILSGGRFITLWALWMFTLECLFLLRYGAVLFRTLTSGWLIAGFVYMTVSLLFLFGNGLLRMFLTSRRLSVMRRILMLFTMWVPLLNFGVFLYACTLVRDEYDFALYKRDLHMIRAESDLCRTKYPVILVHGIFFRDFRYFNYWGRIPRELIRYGAVIDYGNQEAVGTVAYNAEDIRRKILQVLKDTGCSKVNIIAHSKGGLDARYAISKLGMAPYVASLTTMNTPHRGCRFVDKAMKLPRPLIHIVASAFNRTFRNFGDKNPDFYNAVMQFTTAYSQKFNEEVPDDSFVYYQSYTSRMKSMLSDSLLCIPYMLIRILEGENDGLVAVDSARWGRYRGLLSSSQRRGISHGDIIDLKREDYNGFDVTEFYVRLLADLKMSGY